MHDTRVKSNPDRRSAMRFAVNWAAAIRRQTRTGQGAYETGMLQNLSSLGAFFLLQNTVYLGEKVELAIRIPSSKNNWISYNAEVVRLEVKQNNAAVAVRFDSAKPQFIER